jgi:hypothetical protein
MSKNYRFMSYGDPTKVSWYHMLPDQKNDLHEENFNLFFRIMFERQEIWYKRFVKKESRPWTDDPILRDYKYTNVFRELDRASQWLINNVFSDPKNNDLDMIWKTIAFRFFNQPDTFDTGGVELPRWRDFNAEKMWEQVVTLRESGKNPWHTAYMMNLAFLRKPEDWNDRGLFKDHAYIRHAYPKYHKAVGAIFKLMRMSWQSDAKPEDLVSFLETLPAVSHFQSHEFFIDFCYLNKYVGNFMKWNQDSFTNVGPGASLGLRLIFPSLLPNEQEQGIYELRDCAADILATIGHFKYPEFTGFKDGVAQYRVTDKPSITLHQIEMWLCEFSKYWKMKIGQGKQRSKFKPKTKA